MDSNIETDLSIRRADYVILTALSAVVAMIAFELVGEISKTRIAETAPIAITDVDPNSIAVLPFVNMSSDPEQEYFSDGMSEEILNLLARIPGLKVIGRTSSFKFKGKNEDLRVIGAMLGVSKILEGSVRKSGELVRVTAQLIDVSDGSHIWSETYDRTMTDIFVVQDDVATAIIDALQIHIGRNPTRGRPTENTAAYVLFLEARAALNVFDSKGAKAKLRQAVELDPNFAEAYESLAYSYWSFAGFDETAAEAQTLTYNAAAKALAIDSDLVFAQALLESAKTENYSYPREIEAYERAAREQPGNPVVLDTLIYQFLLTGYLQEAVRLAERYIELDPLSPPANFHLINALYAVGRTSEAMAALQVAEQLNILNFTNWIIAEINLAEKRDDIAIAFFEADLKRDGLPSDWVRGLVTGARDLATGQAYLDLRIPQVIASMPEEKAYEWQGRLILWYLLFEFRDRHMEIIVETGSADSGWTGASEFVWVATVYRRLGFTAHPKYLEVAEAIGIVEVWEERGPPDFCEKVGGKWVCE